MVWHHRLEEYNVQGVLNMLVLKKVWVHAAQRQLKSLRDHFLDQSGRFLKIGKKEEVWSIQNTHNLLCM